MRSPTGARRWLAMILSALCLMWVHGLAWGHATQLSSSLIELEEGRADVVLELNARDVDVALQTALLTADGTVSVDGLAAARPAIAAYVLAHARLAAAQAAACQGSVEDVRPKGDHLLVDVR